MIGLIKRAWTVEEATFSTHKQYTAYEIKKLFGIVVSKKRLYENGITSGAISADEILSSRCTFLSPDGAMQAIKLRQQALRIVREKPTKKTLWEVD